MKEQLEQIKAKALADLAAAADMSALDAVRVRVLGKKGELTAVLKQMGIIKAAAIIMFIRISPDASGWRAMASMAELPILPIPIPAPITAKPAPRAAPNLLTPTPAAAACNNTDSNITFKF